MADNENGALDSILGEADPDFTGDTDAPNDEAKTDDTAGQDQDVPADDKADVADAPVSADAEEKTAEPTKTITSEPDDDAEDDSAAEPYAAEPAYYEVRVMNWAAVAQIIALQRAIDGVPKKHEKEYIDLLLAVFDVKVVPDNEPLAVTIGRRIEKEPDRYQRVLLFFSDVLEKRHTDTETRRDGKHQMNEVANFFLDRAQARTFVNLVKVLDIHFGKAKKADAIRLGTTTSADTALDRFDEVVGFPDEKGRADLGELHEFSVWIGKVASAYSGT